MISWTTRCIDASLYYIILTMGLKPLETRKELLEQGADTLNIAVVHFHQDVLHEGRAYRR